jgi:hypothetical protein
LLKAFFTKVFVVFFLVLYELFIYQQFVWKAVLFSEFYCVNTQICGGVMILLKFIFYFTNRFDLALMVYKIKKINGSQKESMPKMIKKKYKLDIWKDS